VPPATPIADSSTLTRMKPNTDWVKTPATAASR
jgi:hypothetical protein